MEPNKLENEFRKKLHQREITPSTNSWDRLDAMLSVAESKKTKRNYNWLYIAASILGFLFIGSIFLSQTEDLIDVRKNNVVIENKQKASPIPEIKENIIPSKSESIVVISEDKNSKANSQLLKPMTKEKKEIIENKINQNPIAEKSIINQKTEQLNLLKKDNVSVDELLTSVESNSKNQNSKPSIKVDASNLLSQVDGELELSFREKVINTIDKNYKTVKVALVNRNQQ